MQKNKFHLLFSALMLALSIGSIKSATAESIILASTTSTQNSGLFDHILPPFTEETGITVNVVAVGTGAALKLARKGDADILMVHHKTSEQAFVKDGFGVERFDLMHNDFVLVGPDSDPAGIKNSKNVVNALQLIEKQQSPFLSRGDDSGTNKRELELWREADFDPKAVSGGWYRETGSGMGATLNTAVAMQGYALTDRATWLSYKNKQNIKVLFEGDKRLFNQYGIIVVNPDKYPHVKIKEANQFVNWLLSPKGQSLIASYKIAGEQLFTPDAVQ